MKLVPIKEEDIRVGQRLKSNAASIDFFSDCVITDVLAGGYVKVARPFFTTEGGISCEKFLVAFDALIDNPNWQIYKVNKDD